MANNSNGGYQDVPPWPPIPGTNEHDWKDYKTPWLRPPKRMPPTRIPPPIFPRVELPHVPGPFEIIHLPHAVGVTLAAAIPAAVVADTVMTCFGVPFWYDGEGGEPLYAIRRVIGFGLSLLGL